MISRHFLTIPAKPGVPARKVHYRRCGKGPPLLMVHQSPRSSAEFAELMELWSGDFTCIAPDIPGFGQSDPLPGEPEVGEFSDALAEFVIHAGLTGCRAYGFHSGSVFLMHVIKRHPRLLGAVAMGAYALWSKDERQLFGERYVPTFEATAYGEHMVWLWNRILEQSWFFPWFDIRDEARMRIPSYSPDQAQAIVMDMLDAGQFYRYGYAASLRAERSLPTGPGLPPVLITAYDGDPLQAHIDRLGALPTGWDARKLATPAAHRQASLEFLLAAPALDQAEVSEDGGEGFIMVDDCSIHWRGKRGAARLVLHAPGAEMAEPGPDEIAIDVPGHGLSGAHGEPLLAVEQAALALDASAIAWPALPKGDPDRLYPDLTPDRFGGHLLKAWGAARAAALFDPWYEAGPEGVMPVDPAAVAPDAIALRARALLRAGAAARHWYDALAARALQEAA